MPTPPNALQALLYTTQIIRACSLQKPPWNAAACRTENWTPFIREKYVLCWVVYHLIWFSLYVSHVNTCVPRVSLGVVQVLLRPFGFCCRWGLYLIDRSWAGTHKLLCPTSRWPRPLWLRLQVFRSPVICLSQGSNTGCWKVGKTITLRKLNCRDGPVALLIFSSVSYCKSYQIFPEIQMLLHPFVLFLNTPPPLVKKNKNDICTAQDTLIAELRILTKSRGQFLKIKGP